MTKSIVFMSVVYMHIYRKQQKFCSTKLSQLATGFYQNVGKILLFAFTKVFKKCHNPKFSMENFHVSLKIHEKTKVLYRGTLFVVYGIMQYIRINFSLTKL